jgi:hypothetical protein
VENLSLTGLVGTGGLFFLGRPRFRFLLPDGSEFFVAFGGLISLLMASYGGLVSFLLASVGGISWTSSSAALDWPAMVAL